MEKKFPFRFFVITFLWSWLILIPIVVVVKLGIIEVDYFNLLISLPVAFIGALGPAVGALFSLRTIEGKGVIKPFLKSFFSLKFGWKAWLSIFLIFGASTFIAWIIPEFFGEGRIASYLPSVYIFPVYLLLMVFFGGGQEEIGWRGYILPFLEKRFGLFIGSLILGIIWAIWHLPLWFIPGTSQSYMNFFGFMLSTIGYSFIFSWIIKISGNKLLSGLLAHGTANAFIPLFPTLVMEPNVSQKRFWIYDVLILAIGIIIVILRTVKSRKNGT
jgi:membrane protease YdiL (CAAX protease family)